MQDAVLGRCKGNNKAQRHIVVGWAVPLRLAPSLRRVPANSLVACMAHPAFSFLLALAVMMCPVNSIFAGEPNTAAPVSGESPESNVLPAKAETRAEAVRNDIIRSIEFEGNVKFKDKVLRQRLGLEVGDHLDPFLAESGRLTLVEIYRKIGFMFVKATLDNEKLLQGHLLYTIEEGPRVRMGQITFEGNRTFGAGTLKHVIKTKERKWFAWPSYYTDDSIDEDLDRLRRFYYDKGFLDYKIAAKKQFSSDSTQVTVVFEIEEGPLYRVGRLLFTGNQYFTEVQLRSAIGGLELSEGQPYLKPDAEKGARQIEELYREHGYVDARVEQTPRFTTSASVRPSSDAAATVPRTPDDLMVDVEFAVTEGQRFRIGRIDIVGNDTTSDKVVRCVLDEYDFTPGNWYNAGLAPKEGGGKLEKYAQRMTMAEEVMIRPVNPENSGDGHKDVRVNVKEGMAGYVMPGVAMSTDSGLTGRLIYEQRNFDISNWPEDFGEFITMKGFRGGGQSLRVSLEPGTEVSQYSFSFTDPYWRDKPVTFDLFGASWTRFRESYDEGRLKSNVRFEKRRKDQWRRSIGFRAENVEVHNIDYDAPQEIWDVEGHTNVIGVKFGAGRYRLDDRFDPSKGDMFNISYEVVTGDYTFGVLGGSYVRYLTLREDALERKTVLAGKVEAAAIQGDAPPFEKFYAGGISQYPLRGFQYRGVSTRGLQTNVDPAIAQYKDSIGSNWVFLASTEMTIPLVGENFAGLLFVDSGTVDTGKYRISVGAGIQIMVPQLLGPVPMRFELATPLCRDELDDTQVFSFTWGNMFSQ